MKNIMCKILVCLVLVLLSSCFYTGAVYEASRDTLLDGVKLIRSDIQSGDDASTFFQQSYTLNAQSRLLLRREDLLDDVDKLNVDQDHPALLTLVVLDSTQVDSALNNLQLCPLAKNWMMLATWYEAHPFAPSGDWNGGDSIDESCVLPTLVTDSTTKIQYDVSEHFKALVIGARQSYGWILKNDSSDLTVGGEKNAISYPRLSWSELYQDEPVNTQGL